MIQPLAYLPMIAVLMLALWAAVSAQTGGGSYREFGDWAVACDNVRTCTAVGFGAPDQSMAYMVIVRDGDANALPSVTFAVHSDGPARDRTLTATIPAAHGHPVSIGPFDAVGDGRFARATSSERVMLLFLATLRRQHTLRIALTDAPAASERGTVLLDGMSAALRWMDVQQHRNGTATALVARGDRPAGAVPQPPRVPLLTAQPLRPIDAPRPDAATVTAADPICASVADLVYEVAPGDLVRGVCVVGGAYNIGYRFFQTVPNGTTTALAFPTPWRSPAVQSQLANVTLSSNGKRLQALAKGIGLATCGEASEWIWNGSGFRIFRFSELRACRGVPPEDWPVEYRARL